MGYTATLGTSYTIIHNVDDLPITGTFNVMYNGNTYNLPEGAAWSFGGQTFVITYNGNGNNDVVLTRTNTFPAYSESLDGSGNLTITQAYPLANDQLSFSLAGGNYAFTDAGGLTFNTPTGAGAGSITGGLTNSISIPSADVTSITVTLGVGTNVFTFTGGSAAVAPLSVNTGSAAGDEINIAMRLTDSGAVSLTSPTIIDGVGDNLIVGSLTLKTTVTGTIQGNVQVQTGNLTMTGSGSTTISGNIDLGSTGNLIDSSTGNDTVSGAIGGEALTGTSSTQGLFGTYFQIGNGSGQQSYISPATSSNSSWIGNQTPAARALLTGSVDFPDISDNGFEDNNSTTYVNFGNNNNSVEARWYGEIDIPNNGQVGNPISFQTASDDGSMLYIDGAPVVNNNNYQGVTNAQGTLNLTPGLHSIDIEYYNGGGGAAMFARWDPTGGSSFVDIPNSVFSAVTPLNGISKTGTGTLTLTHTNTILGPTTIEAGKVIVTANGALGTASAAGITVSANAALAFSGGVNYTTAEPATVTGSGPGVPLPTGYVGFTGATGGANSVQNILNWTYNSGATNINYGGGFATNNLNLNGGATIQGSALQLTDGNNNEQRTAWVPTTVPVASFTSTFQWTYGPNPQADGFTFAVQNDSNTVIGSTGGGSGLGYEDIPGDSFAVQFNVYTGSGTGSGSDFGVGIDGAINHDVDLTSHGINFHNNPTDVYQAVVANDGLGDLMVNVWDTDLNPSGNPTGPAYYSQTFSIASTFLSGNGAIENLSGNNTFSGSITTVGNATIGSDAGTLTLNGTTTPTLGISTTGNLQTVGAGNIDIESHIVPSGPPAPSSYVGFTGGTGGLNSVQNILNWNYTSGATTIDDSTGFSSENLTLNGSGISYNPSFPGTSLQLTDGNNGEASTAWTPTQVPVNNFTTNFQFTYAGTVGSPADGFTFAVQNDGSTALGAGGGGLGYNGIPGTSYAVEFNQYNGSGTGSGSDFGVGVDGAINHMINLAGSGINFTSNANDTFETTIVNDGAGHLTVTVWDATLNPTGDPLGGAYYSVHFCGTEFWRHRQRRHRHADPVRRQQHLRWVDRHRLRHAGRDGQWRHGTRYQPPAFLSTRAGRLAFSGGVNYTTAEPVNASGSGPAGNGAD